MRKQILERGVAPLLLKLPLPLLREGGQGDRLPSRLLRGLTQSKVSKGGNKLSAVSYGYSFAYPYNNVEDFTPLVLQYRETLVMYVKDMGGN